MKINHTQIIESKIYLHNAINCRFIAILIPVIGNASENHIALIMIPFIITIISSIMIGIFYRKFDARYPKLGEKHYTEKAFNIMDEGERYITLVSLYKVHQQNIVLLL